MYVLEYLPGTYCTSQGESIIEQGSEMGKGILVQNYVRLDKLQRHISNS